METLQCAGDVTLVEIEPDENAPDLVFTGNTALISGNLAVLSSFRHPERRRQQGAFRAALSRTGLATTYLRQTYFEGQRHPIRSRAPAVLYRLPVAHGARREHGALRDRGMPRLAAIAR